MLREIIIPLNEKKISFKALKDSGSLMSKWKLKSKYLKGFAEFKNGRGSSLEIFELIDYDASIKYEDDEDTFYDVVLHMKNLDTGKIIKIDQDDRYGYYPSLTKKRKENIEDLYYSAKETVDALEVFIKKI